MQYNFKSIKHRSFSLTTKSNLQTGSAASGLLFFLSGVLVLSFLTFFVFGQIVPPNKIGIRQNYFGFGVLEKGFVSNGLPPGLHWKIPGLSTIHLLPRDFMFVHFNDQNLGGDLDVPTLEVPTTDGSKVKSDITVVLRLFESPNTGLAAPTDDSLDYLEISKSGVPFGKSKMWPNGGPRDLVQRYTISLEKQLFTFRRKAEDALRNSLSKLSTTDYYNPDLRERAAILSANLMNKTVNPDGMEVWGSLIRRYVYSEQQIDDQIFAKILQEQTKRLNTAKSELSDAKAETEKANALWDAKIKDLQVEGQSTVRRVRSEGDLNESKMRAEGDLLVAEASASIDAARAQIFSNVQGADVYIARELAPLLATLSGGIVSGIDPYNINDWVKKLTATD